MFRALKERFNWTSWETWPAEIAKRDPEALTLARRELADAIEMYSYWQYIAHRQWSEMRAYASSHGAFIGGDLAFSPCHDSAEVWANQDEFDLSRTVGAPPDGFNPKGQRWGLPLPNWNAMRAQGFKVLRNRARHASTLYDLLRIDHVVGLYRTFNFGSDFAEPGVFTPVNEHDELLQGEEVIRAIKEEAGATELIAEDLGTVPPWVRASLTNLGVPGYKVMQWERDWGHGDEPFISPAAYPELSLATTGTHDTEPLTVWWRAQPIDVREKFVRALGLEGKVSPRTDARGVVALCDSGCAVCGAVEARDRSDPGFVWMEYADQSARHDQRVELDLSNPADAGTDASKSGDTRGRREAARNCDQERAVRVDQRSLLFLAFFVSF